MNLYGHIAVNYTPRYGYDPGSKPTYPPIIDENASTDDVVAWYDWWCCDGQVFHLLFSQLSATACSQLSGVGATHHDHHTARELYMELVNLFGGTNFNTAAAICEELSHLLCAPARVNNYITHWRSGLNQLQLAGHPFDHADSLRFFVNHLLLGSTYDIIQQQVLFNLGKAKSPEHLPSFESVVEHVHNIELNCSSFQPACSRISNSNMSSTPNTTPTSMPKDTSAPTTATTSNSQTHTPCSANFCMICHQTGHTADKHKQGGDQEGGITDRGKQSAPCGYMTDLDVDSGVDGGVLLAESLSPPSTPVVNEDSSTPFAALGTTDFVPSVTSIVNEDVLFDLYRNGVMPLAFSSIEDSSLFAFAAISNLYNTILDSGCTNHIIKDHSLFWTYHMFLAVPVKTANCGILETFAKGDIKFHIQCGNRSIVFTLHDCLHAPGAPINLLSVGTMKYHFSCDVISNELIPGHLSPSRLAPSSSSPPPLPLSSLLSSSPPPPPHPVQAIQHTTKGQTFAESIHLHDERLALKQGGAPHPQQSLSAISDFVYLSIADEILITEPAIDMGSYEHDSLSTYCFLTSIDRLHFQHPLSFDLCKPPESYHEALAHPDSAVWLAAM